MVVLAGMIKLLYVVKLHAAKLQLITKCDRIHVGNDDVTYTAGSTRRMPFDITPQLLEL